MDSEFLKLFPIVQVDDAGPRSDWDSQVTHYDHEDELEHALVRALVGKEALAQREGTNELQPIASWDHLPDALSHGSFLMGARPSTIVCHPKTHLDLMVALQKIQPGIVGYLPGGSFMEIPCVTSRAFPRDHLVLLRLGVSPGIIFFRDASPTVPTRFRAGFMIHHPVVVRLIIPAVHRTSWAWVLKDVALFDED